VIHCDLCLLQIEEVSSEDIDSILKSIDKELSAQKARLADPACRTNYRDLVEPRFVLDKKKVAAGKVVRRHFVYLN
jgi:hypothetical protein